jgi:hypothetical protein
MEMRGRGNGISFHATGPLESSRLALGKYRISLL